MLPIEKVLAADRGRIGRVVEPDLDKENIIVFDFTSSNKAMNSAAQSPEKLREYVRNMMARSNAVAGIGRYGEDRVIYRQSSLFGSERTLHLGIDIAMPEGTE